MTAPSAVQTLWCDLLVGSLVDAGVSLVVVSPGSRSTPLVTALALLARTTPALSLVTIIDERSAAFYALGAARATSRPVALVCTSGSAGAHYLPAVIEAAQAGIPLIAITADRPPELLDCGASQTIDQVHLFGRFVRGSFDVGAPTGTQPALRALRRKLVQAVTLARGPLPGPVHLEVPLRKPLEPIAPHTDEERALSAFAHALRGPAQVAPPSLAPDAAAIGELAAAIAAEPDGLVVVGALPPAFAAARDAVLALAERAGYPVIAEAGSQVRIAPASDHVLRHVDLIPVAHRPAPRLVIQLGAEPVAASWQHWDLARAQRWVLAATWADPTSSARVVLGDPAASLAALVARVAERSSPQQRIRTAAWRDTWRDLDDRAARNVERALAEHPRSESAALRAALASLPPGAAVQIGNSLPIRVVDQVAPRPATPHAVLTQRGAAGIDGLISSAAGATHASPVLLVLGDVSFAHDVGGLLATRAAVRPLAILVVDNRGGQIFAGLPVAKAGIDASVVAEHWITAPELDPAAVATAMGVRAITAASPAAIASAIDDALASDAARVTVIHAPVSVSGAHDVRRASLDLFAAPQGGARSGGLS